MRIAKSFVGACAALAMSVAWSGDARAVLTASEQDQVRQLVVSGQLGLVERAARVRALVARPDLTPDESAASLSAPLASVPFTEARAVFLRELIFGGASAPSRAVLVTATVRALFARADAILAKSPGDLDARPDAAAELLRLYAFLDERIANAGQPRGVAHDPSNGIPESAYAECAKVLGEHVKTHAARFKGDAKVSPATSRVRAELQIAALDLMSDASTRRVDAADRLALTGARRRFLTTSALLWLDDGKVDDAPLDHLRLVLDRFALASTRESEAIWIGDAQHGLTSRGRIVRVGIASPPSATSAGERVWPSDVDPGSIDPFAFEATRAIALVSIPRALLARAELRAQAERDVRAMKGDATRMLGLAVDENADQALATAVAMLLHDAPRAVTLAAARFAAGKPEAAALMSDALGVLATSGSSSASSGASGATDGFTIALGAPKADDRSTETTLATHVRLSPIGAVLAFTLGGHHYAFTRDDAGVVTAFHRGGAAVTLAMFPMARVPVTDGPSWSLPGASSLVFAKLQGAPRAGVAPGPRIRVVGTDARGFDAIVTQAPSDDVIIETDLTVTGGSGGIVARAFPIADAFRGVSLLVEPGAPGAPARASLVAGTGTGAGSSGAGSTETTLAAAVALPPQASYHVRIVVRGMTIEAQIGAATLRAQLPAYLTRGDVALRAARGATLDAGGFTLRKP
jgi:hypothetical protein